MDGRRCCLLLSLLVIAHHVIAGPGPSQESLKPIRLVQSKPVVVNDVKFVVVGEADWKLPKEKKSVPLLLQLQVTNLSKSDLDFSTNDIEMKIRHERGGPVPLTSGGNDSFVLRHPVRLSAGATLTVCPEPCHFPEARGVTLWWDKKSEVLQVGYQDGQAGWRHYGPLTPGRYVISFQCGRQVGPASEKDRKAETPREWRALATASEIIVEVHGE